MSKLNPDKLTKSINSMLQSAKAKKRKFIETVELQFTLKFYDPKKDKRFAGTIKVPHPIRPSIRVCIIGDAAHIDVAKEMKLDYIDFEGVKGFMKKDKEIKKWSKKYDAFFASDTLLKRVTRIIGPVLNKQGKFPILIKHTDSIEEKIKELNSTVSFQLKKSINIHTAIGNIKTTPDHLKANMTTAINFFVSLLKKNWQNVKSIHIKTTMSPSFRIY
ncbi:ribosomal protein [Anaeramoeba ignava]|uniref:Ribosomal protein n=1 Tax=Anaeramoeba ignava TaxID=1746090 RepID=A0A9Q0R9H4_ANAIG|nr:ribosomal protein [Anaeramoeba ignava]